MFTGIISHIGTVRSRSESGGVVRAVIETGMASENLQDGESIAVNGACLTVESSTGNTFTVTLSPESLRRTARGYLAPGSHVNLERALRMGDRLGGHLVLGHVDGIAKLADIRMYSSTAEGEFETESSIARYIVAKGSVTVDGVSLTVSGLDNNRFIVALVPFTLKHTILGQRHPGEEVNVETDIMARYVEKYVQFPGAKLTMEKIKEWGY